jgi:hypothetical protein
MDQNSPDLVTLANSYTEICLRRTANFVSRVADASNCKNSIGPIFCLVASATCQKTTVRVNRPLGTNWFNFALLWTLNKRE